jgi:ferredoxin--NADP+ reductase
VQEIDVQRNAIARDGDGTLRARATGDPVETIECDLVLRSVGYRAVPLPDVPFDERAFILPNECGRALDEAGAPVPGVYAVGWIKRGPTGILGTNKRDAEETVACVAEDLREGALPEPAKPGREAIDALLAERRPGHVTADGWHAIDAAELRRGRDEQRPRVKLASHDELVAAAS